MLYLVTFIILAIPTLLYFLWGRWIWKNRKTASKFVIVGNLILFSSILLYIGYQFRIIPGSQKIANRSYVKELTGKTFWVYEEFDYQSIRSFNGDGHSFTIYSFSSEIAKEFENPKDSFFSDFPLNKRDRWESSTWKKTPIKSYENKIVDHAVWIESTLDESNKHEEVQFVRSLLMQEGNYYAYNYLEHSNLFVSDVDFYILSPQEKVLVCINHNT